MIASIFLNSNNSIFYNNRELIESLPKLHVNVETVQKISPKGQTVHRSQHSMNPSWKIDNINVP